MHTQEQLTLINRWYTLLVDCRGNLSKADPVDIECFLDKDDVDETCFKAAKLKYEEDTKQCLARERHKKKYSTKAREIKMLKILKSHNIELELAGCGCCDSPWFKFSYNGELIYEDDNVGIGD